MLYKEIPLHLEGSLPEAKLVVYIQDYSEGLYVKERPLVLLCPGGGYAYTSDREAESIALQFLAMGYHAAVLRYSPAPAVYPTQLKELAYSMKYIRAHAAEWHIGRDKIVVQGCSAGGHLAASLGVFWTEEWLGRAVDTVSEEIRPNGLLLCYPVITSGEFAHRGSFDNLTGGDDSLLEKLSLEKQVNAHTPKIFLWHTFTDGSVPMENSLLFVSALRKYNIPTEFHLYPEGRHGLALANELTAGEDGGHVQKECTSWVELAHTWLKNV